MAEIIAPVGSDDNVIVEPSQPAVIQVENSAGIPGPTGPTGPEGPSGPAGSVSGYYDVTSYGAIGDGTTDDTAAIQSAIDDVVSANGGTLYFPPGNYKTTGSLTIDPVALNNLVKVLAYGARLTYTGSSDALVIETNIASSDIQHAERSVHIEGLHIIGSSSASSAIRNKASFTTLKNLVIEDFTSITSQEAAIIMDASFHYWVEECYLDSIDIKNTGNGICFISQDDSGGTSASVANNFYTNIHIWVNVAGGKGVYGVGLGATTVVQIARSVFNGMVIHVLQNNVISYDLTSCYCAGTVFLAPSVDVFGAPTGLTGWKYTFNGADDILTLAGPTIFPVSGVATWFDGGGAFNIIGGNLGSKFITDTEGNTTVKGLKLLDKIYDNNGAPLINQNAIASAINYLTVQNAAAAGDVWLYPGGGDTNVNLALVGKGSGGLKLAGLTATTVPYIDANNLIKSSAITPTELGYLSGVTSAIQTQLSAKQAVITFGTGVLTALGINIGSAGAPVLFNGALGTPSSGVANNLTGNAAGLTVGAAAILSTARSIYGNSFDGSSALSQIISSVYGGTGNGFTKFSGPSGSEKTFTLPNTSATILTNNTPVTPAQGGSGATTLELFLKPDYTTGNYSNYGNHRVLALGNASSCYFEFTVPAGFSSLSSIEILGIPDATETIQFDVAVDCAQVGQIYSNRQDSLTDQTKSTVLNTIWSQSISAAVDGLSLAPGDVVGIKFTSNTDFLYLLGLRIKYA